MKKKNEYEGVWCNEGEFWERMTIKSLPLKKKKPKRKPKK